jgi:hypothetical protein
MGRHKGKAALAESIETDGGIVQALGKKIGSPYFSSRINPGLIELPGSLCLGRFKVEIRQPKLRDK